LTCPHTFSPCDQDFIKRSLQDIKEAVAGWLEEPSTYSTTILNTFHFLIDGKAKKDIESFIRKKPKEKNQDKFGIWTIFERV